MTIIEQAARRLEELRRAGVTVPWAAGGAPDPLDGRVNATPTLALRKTEYGKEAAANEVIEPEVVRSVPLAQKSLSVELDLDRLQAKGYLVLAMVRSSMAKEFRHIKRTLLKNARDDSVSVGQRRNIIMVASALPGEGKTFCAINLAMSIAMEVDSSVLLVDADVVRPSVLRNLGLQPSRGLMDLLNGSSDDMSSVMLKTNVPKLTLLPSGTNGVNSTELLDSAAMQRLLDELASRYADRIIVVDTPPLLLTTESRALASRVGQIVMVVEASKTSQASVVQAFAAIDQCPFVYSVLNKCTSVSTATSHGYDEYY